MSIWYFRSSFSFSLLSSLLIKFCKNPTGLDHHRVITHSSRRFIPIYLKFQKLNSLAPFESKYWQKKLSTRKDQLKFFGAYEKLEIFLKASNSDFPDNRVQLSRGWGLKQLFRPLSSFLPTLVVQNDTVFWVYC